MSDPLFYRFDGVILEVLDLLKRIELNGGTSIDHQEFHRTIKKSLDQVADAPHREVRLVKYAVVAWIDEMMQSCGWEPRKQDWWINHCLEMECFGTSIAYSEFYRRAKQAREESLREVVEAYAMIVAMGFRGCYRNEPLDRSSIGDDLIDLPDFLEQWADEYFSIVPTLEVEALPQPDAPSFVGAPPLKGSLQLVLPSLMAFVIATILLTLLWNALKVG